uniref:Uncharacterized protein n=1 Tax=Arundo donax TaxID=35708 RepID=A0A0A9GEY4_ARUDO
MTDSPTKKPASLFGHAAMQARSSYPVLPAEPRRRPAAVAVRAFRAHRHLVVRRLRVPCRGRWGPVHRLPHHHDHAASAAGAGAVHAVAAGAIVAGRSLLQLRAGAGARGGRATGGHLLALELAELVEVELERLDVVLEAERGHGPEEVVAVDGLALLALALVGGLAGDEGDELGDALLHRLLGVLGDLGVGRKRLLHDPAHVRDRQEPVLLPRRRELRVARPPGLVVGVRHRRRAEPTNTAAFLLPPSVSGQVKQLRRD